MKRHIRYIALLAAGLLASGVSAQQTIVKASVDSVDLVMGDRAHIEVSVEVPTQYESSLQLVDFPVLTPGAEYIPFHGVDVVASDSTTTRLDGRTRYDFDFTIQAFDPGTVSLPPFAVVPAPGADTVKSSVIALKIAPVDVDSLETIHPMAGLASPAMKWYDFIPDWFMWIFVGIFVRGICVVAFVLLKQRKAVIEERKAAPVPPYDLAKLRLEKLRSRNLAESGHEKEYYTELVDILRQYLQGRFGINAMEMTSTQIVRALRSNPETRMTADEMRGVLSVADFVKFAKVRPLPDDNVKAFNRAQNFVDSTKPVEIPAEENPDGDKGDKTVKTSNKS